MKDKIFGVLQRVGRSFMLPIALLPVAGLLLGLGSSFTNATMLEAYNLTGIMGQGTFIYAILSVMSAAGNSVFANLPLLFAMGVAIGMAKNEKEVAALAAAESDTKKTDNSSTGGEVYAPMQGKVIPLAEVGDGVFSEGMLGGGVAIEPESGRVTAPFDGEVQMVYETKHALGLMSEDGIELLIHIGIDTVQLNGECFDIKVADGQKIKKGQLLAQADLDGITKAGYRTVTPVIVTNSDDFETLEVFTDNSGDKIISVK